MGAEQEDLLNHIQPVPLDALLGIGVIEQGRREYARQMWRRNDGKEGRSITMTGEDTQSTVIYG